MYANSINNRKDEIEIASYFQIKFNEFFPQTQNETDVLQFVCAQYKPENRCQLIDVYVLVGGSLGERTLAATVGYEIGAPNFEIVSISEQAQLKVHISEHGDLEIYFYLAD